MQVRESQGDKLKALMESKGEGRITSLEKGEVTSNGSSREVTTDTHE